MKIAILGGTFNPIHLGHLAMAEHVLKNCKMDRICFLPNGQPPHKNDDIADKHHRLEMVKLAIKTNPAFYVSDYEINQEKRCYTVDTMSYFNSLDDEYHFILGADSLFQLPHWKDVEKLKKICSFIVCDRTYNGDTADLVEKLRLEGCRIMLTDMPLIDIDSTTIRQRVRDNLDISDYTTEKVAQYIFQNKLYS